MDSTSQDEETSQRPRIGRSVAAAYNMCMLFVWVLTPTPVSDPNRVGAYPAQDPQRGGSQVPERRVAIENLEEERAKVFDLRLPTERHAAPHRQCLEGEMRLIFAQEKKWEP